MNISKLFSFDKTMTSSNKKVIFCLDISGSTGGIRPYHDLSRQIYDSIKDLSHIIIGWNSGYRILSDSEYMNIATSMRGFGGTMTSAIAYYLETLVSQEIDLIILTDGQVEQSDIYRCDQVMQNVVSRNKITSVSAFISSRSSVNCSVLAPFLRGDWTTNVNHHNQIVTIPTQVHFIDATERNELIALVKTATSEDQINAIYDRLVSLLTAMTMGKRDGDPTMRSMILEMFKRIKDNVKKTLSQNSILSQIETEFFDTKNISVDSARNLMNWYNTAFNGDEFQTKINFLLQMCDGKLSHLFDPSQVRAASLQRATVTTTAQSDTQLAQIVPSDTVTPIQCPIMLDDSANMIVMLSGTPLFNEIDKGMQDAIMSNTFFATSLADQIKNRLDHAISLEAYLNLPNQSQSPMTRNEICGCLVLGADDVSVKATNYALGKMILGKTGIIGNPDIWFYVIYHIIKSGNAPWLESTLPMFENQLRYRMMHSNCTISMSGLPTHVQLKTKFGVSLRFVLSQVELDMKKEQSSFPIFSGSAQHIITLLKMLGCDIPQKLVKYCTVVHHLGRLVAEVKQTHLDPFKVKYRALIGNFHRIKMENLTQCVLDDALRNGWFYEYIPLDGTQTCLPDFASDMTTDMRNLTYNLVQLITTESITTFTIMTYIKYDDVDKLFVTPQPLENDWKLYQHPFKYDDHTVTIHPRTLRPVTYDSGQHWMTQFNKYFNGDKILSYGQVFNGCHMYGKFINTFKIHPTLDDFVLYCYTRCKNSQHRHKTIPFVEFCQLVINFYDFTRTIPIDTFITKYNASRNHDERIKLESG